MTMKATLDATCLELDVGLLGHFQARHRPSILTVEFERFRDQLRVLNEKLAGTAALEHTEEQVGLTVCLNAGKGAVEGFLADSTAGRLSFENIEIDQSCVRPVARAVRRDRRSVPGSRRVARVSRRPAVNATRGTHVMLRRRRCAGLARGSNRHPRR